MMYSVYIIGSGVIVENFETESQAEKFCEEWGWNYDGSEGCGMIGIMERSC